MDDAALEARFHRIERRQNVMLVLLIGPYLYAVAKIIGFWVAGVLAVLVGLVVLTVAIRRGRRDAHQRGP
ncbi:MAG: hypothetical protein ABEI31_07535 [Halodesulfurarchaeum sp.]